MSVFVPDLGHSIEVKDSVTSLLRSVVSVAVVGQLHKHGVKSSSTCCSYVSLFLVVCRFETKPQHYHSFCAAGVFRHQYTLSSVLPLCFVGTCNLSWSRYSQFLLLFHRLSRFLSPSMLLTSSAVVVSAHGLVAQTQYSWLFASWISLRSKPVPTAPILMAHVYSVVKSPDQFSDMLYPTRVFTQDNASLLGKQIPLPVPTLRPLVSIEPLEAFLKSVSSRA